MKSEEFRRNPRVQLSNNNGHNGSISSRNARGINASKPISESLDGRKRARTQRQRNAIIIEDRKQVVPIHSSITNGNGNGVAPIRNGLSVATPGRKNSCRELNIVVLGLSITSSWGNGHATTYRALIKELSTRGHHVLFLERNLRWYAANRDLPKPDYCRLGLYNNLKQLKERFRGAIRNADLVIVGSYVPEGIEVGKWVTSTTAGATAFYDIDTPVTIGKLKTGTLDYLSLSLLRSYDMYFSFTGGPMLDVVERYGARMPRPLYCSVDPTLYFPEDQKMKWDLGYMGTYSDDRQPALEEFLLKPARAWNDGAFVVAGPQYPRAIRWPKNVRRFTHVEPKKHRVFYNQQRFTLNLTREQMIEAGYSPSVRLFEAAACGTPIISDLWQGLDHFFKPNYEILIATSEDMVLRYLLNLSEQERRSIGAAARQKVLAKHTSKHRAIELENYTMEVLRPTVASI